MSTRHSRHLLSLGLVPLAGQRFRSPSYGFGSIEQAGAWRRHAMRERDEFRRKAFIRKARASIAWAAQMPGPVLEREVG